jgi:TPR repeat protein
MRNEAEAVKWYTMASKLGEVKSSVNLGVMYAEGKGSFVCCHDVPPSNHIFLQWRLRVKFEGGGGTLETNTYRQCSKKQSPHTPALPPIGIPRDEKKAFEFYAVAAQQGDPFGMFNMSNALKNGSPNSSMQPHAYI